MAAKKNSVTPATPTYLKEALIEAARVFGTTPELMTGALYGVDGPLTKDQAKEKLKAFLARPVKQ